MFFYKVNSCASVGIISLLVLLLPLPLLLFTLTSCNALPSTESNPRVNAKFLTPIERELLKRSKAADIKSWMNTTEEPCNDFYNFACGNWQRINSASVLDVSSTDQQDVAYDGLNKRLHAFLTTPTKLGASVENKIHKFYESCRSVGKTTCSYSNSLKKMYEEFGQFSYLKKNGRDKLKTEFIWWATVADIQNVYGKSILISTVVNYDLKSKGKAMIYIEEPHMQGRKSSEKVQKLTRLYGATVDQARKVAANVAHFEKALHQAGVEYSKAGYSPDERHNLYNTTESQDLFRSLFDLETFLRISLHTTELPDEIYVQNNKYFENLAILLSDTDPDTVEDYILLMLLDDYATIDENQELDHECDLYAYKYFSKYIDYITYKEFRSVEYEMALVELWHDVKAVFLDDLRGEKYQWMSNITREYAIRKLNRMSFVVDSYENVDFRDYYKELSIDSTNFVGNTQSILRHAQTKKGDRLRVKAIDYWEGSGSQSRFVQYFYRKNQIKVPIFTLQPFQLWHPAYPKAIKYGVLGTMVAHEMIHAFDNFGRHYDAEGNVNNWWDEKSAYEFELRRLCFQTQYRNFTFAGHHLPDATDQNENIADNAGVRVAYLAYNRWLERAKNHSTDVVESETLKTLPYNNHELFFIGYGQQSCTDVREDAVEDYVSNEDHIPKRLRVFGSLSNYLQFSQVFKCYTESAMNPTQKCEMF